MTISSIKSVYTRPVLTVAFTVREYPTTSRLVFWHGDSISLSRGLYSPRVTHYQSTSMMRVWLFHSPVSTWFSFSVRGYQSSVIFGRLGLRDYSRICIRYPLFCRLKPYTERGPPRVGHSLLVGSTRTCVGVISNMYGVESGTPLTRCRVVSSL